MGLREGFKRFVQEVGQTLRDKIVQGADELSNAIFHGTSYMPWPGHSRPTITQEANRFVAVQEAVKAMQTPTISAPLIEAAQSTTTSPPMEAVQTDAPPGGALPYPRPDPTPNDLGMSR